MGRGVKVSLLIENEGDKIIGGFSFLIVMPFLYGADCGGDGGDGFLLKRTHPPAPSREGVGAISYIRARMPLLSTP